MTTDDYLARQLAAHASRWFTGEACAALRPGLLRFLPWSEAVATREPAVVVPTDVSADGAPRDVWQVPFGAARLTLWHRLPAPGAEWDPLPGPATPLWHRHPSGTVLPAWNLFALVLDLLTAREERESTLRDRHGRFVGSASSRDACRLLDVPVFNEAAAALAAAAAGIRSEGRPRLDPQGLVRRWAAALSHDVDLLRGDDLWTQAIRCYRLVEPLRRGRPPRLHNLRWLVANAAYPRTHYLESIGRLVEAERRRSFRSAFYFLNGSGGRFGARSGSGLLPEAVGSIPAGWTVGMHYNYDTLLDETRFAAQKSELERLTGRPITTGRAHYLRLHPVASYPFLARQGIRCDESGGYPDRVGFRYGIAGPFEPYDPDSRSVVGLRELPLVVMDGTLVDRFRGESVAEFRRLAGHVATLGGALGVLAHPGAFHNPELPEVGGVYEDLLDVVRELGGEGAPADELVAADAASTAS